MSLDWRRINAATSLLTDYGERAAIEAWYLTNRFTNNDAEFEFWYSVASVLDDIIYRGQQGHQQGAGQQIVTRPTIAVRGN